MRPARMLLGTALVLAVAWPARGEPAPLAATVLTDGAEVRGKPSTEAAVAVTQKLPRGSAVTVVEQMANGWLKIEPPPGSFSWVPTRSLRPPDSRGGGWAVEESVPTLVGSWVVLGQRPQVIGTTLSRGAQVVAVSAPVRQEDGDWLRIQPPAGEYRYVLAKDVTGLPGATSPTTTSAHPGTPPLTPVPAGGGDLPSLPGAPAKSPPQSLDVHVGGAQPPAEPLLQEAERLEHAGDKLGAARVYDQLGTKYRNSDHEAAVQYVTRAGWLRTTASPAAPVPVTDADAIYKQARDAEANRNWPEAIRQYNRLGDLFDSRDVSLSLQYYNRAGWLKQKHPPTADAAPPPATTATPAPVPAPQGAVVQARAISVKDTGPGRIASSPTPLDGLPTYILESAQGTTIAYLTPQTPQASAELQRALGQNVKSVLGDAVQRNDLRVMYMKVNKVMPLDPPPLP